MNDYLISFFVTTFFEDNGDLVMYNWLNSENVRITAHDHPMYVHVSTKASSYIEPFEVDRTYDDFDFLVSCKFLVSSQEESRDEARRIYSETTNTQNLNMVLMPAEQHCNFGCVYCHEDRTRMTYMGDKELEILEKFIRKWSPKTFRADFFGGEPLLNSKFIINFMLMVQQLSDSMGFEFVSSSMTSNGYLLELELFKKLLSLRLTTYQITLDGVPEFHNLLRPTVSGKPTFEKIYNNLLAISKLPRDEYVFSITIRMNFNTQSAALDKRKPFFEQLAKDFGNDDRFIFMVQMISNWKEEKHEGDLYCSVEEGNALQLVIENELEAKGLQTVPMVLYGDYGSNFCYSGNPNNVIVYPFNEDMGGVLPIEKCTLVVNKDVNQVGHIDKQGEIHRTKQWDFWTSDPLFKDEKCKSCFYVLNCFGRSCALNNLKKGVSVCPEQKWSEVKTVKRILQFIENG